MTEKKKHFLTANHNNTLTESINFDSGFFDIQKNNHIEFPTNEYECMAPSYSLNTYNQEETILDNYSPQRTYNPFGEYTNTISIDKIAKVDLFNSEYDAYLNITDYIRRETPKFLLNLYRILSYNTCKSICWNSNGTGFIILDKILFMEEVGPYITKSKDISAFTRQLSNYGFSKSKKFISEADKDEYCSPYFMKGRPDLLFNGSKTNQNIMKNNQIQPLSFDLDNKNREIWLKLKMLEESNFDLQKHIMNLEKKNKLQSIIMEKMACFMSKIYFSQLDLNSLSTSDLNIFRNLCKKFPNLELEIRNRKQIENTQKQLPELQHSNISEIFEEVEKLEGKNFMEKEIHMSNFNFEDFEFLKDL